MERSENGQMGSISGRDRKDRETDNMRRKGRKANWAVKAFLVSAAAILLVLVLNFIYLQDRANFDWETEKFGEVQQPVLCNVGSSHGEYGFNYTELRQQGADCFNFALPSQMFDYDLALLKQYRSHLKEGTVVLIPISYFSFTDETLNTADQESRKVRYYQFMDPENIPDYDWFVDLTTHRLPILSAGSKILKLPYDFLFWGKDYEEEALSFTLQVQARGSSSPEDADGAESMEPQAEELQRFEEIAAQRFERHFADRPVFFQEDRTRQLEEMIDYCLENGWRPVLLTTPFYESYTKMIDEDFLERFDRIVREIADSRGISYYNYGVDERFNHTIAYFGDPDHLNTEGSLYFMRLLCKEIPEVRDVTANCSLQ